MTAAALRVICLVIGYGFGLIQSGYIYSQLHGKDIRDYGSGNSGSTNVMRVMGRKAGVVVMICDIGKAIAACLLVQFLFRRSVPELFPLLKIYAGAGVVLGHDFPFYMKFKGGKGIAAVCGLAMVLGDWRVLLISAGVFFGAIVISRYVSLGSILGLITFFLTWTIFCITDGIQQAPYVAESCILIGLLAVLGIWQHRSNIVRLCHGTENKLGSGKKEKE